MKLGNRLTNLNLATQWLLKSIDPKTGGSRAYYSLLYKGLKGWAGPYPETTGYIIPTLLNLAEKNGQKMTIAAAVRMADWLLSLQNPDGSFPGGVYSSRKAGSKSVFNSAQIIIGLVSVYELSGETKYLSAAIKACDWLTENQNSAGVWDHHNYVPGFSPSYYSRVAWPILMVSKHHKQDNYVAAGDRCLEYIAGKRNNNGFVRDCGFKPDQPAFLHTVAYTIRGFLESYLITGEKLYYEVALKFGSELMQKFEIRKKLGAEYRPDYSQVSWYQCLTGNAQMAIIWLKLFHQEKDPRFISAASKAIDQVAKYQIKASINPNLVGAVSGSYPVYGKYMDFRYPNWAVKFFIDALLLEERCYVEVQEHLMST